MVWKNGIKCGIPDVPSEIRVPAFRSGLEEGVPYEWVDSTGEKQKQRVFPTDVFELEMTLECTTKIPVIQLNVEDRPPSQRGQSWG